MSIKSKEWPPRYDPVSVEKKIYRFWLDNDCFSATPSGKDPFVIVIPPPNVTGILTMGHVLNNTLQDILIRWQRMLGREALWLPGTDHAGIATQNVVEKSLAGKGLKREDLGREKFVKRVWQWKEKYGGTIIEQLKRLGCSCDWSRGRFTMDPGLSRAVEEVFIRLYKKGLIYRGPYLINWCPRCHTALSDEEVEHQEHEGFLWHIRYPLREGGGYVTVATTRPETMLGDTAVAVNPADKRYAKLIGKKVTLPFVEREIPIIADDFVDPAFGTGLVKVTPAHDPNDFLIGQRHKLPQVVVMDTSGRMNSNAGTDFEGMDRFECRKKLIKMLRDRGLEEKIEKHSHSVGHCYRCHTVIEPYLSVQWFVRMAPLAEAALRVVLDGKIKFYPRRWVKVYRHWMENIRDWCISRQLWWGHRIPAWYRGDEIHVGSKRPSGKGWVQDEDVLDTWFSSWLWPFSTLGWPDQTPDLKNFYPTSCLVTAPDIIFFWVARMIMAGMEFMGEVPFKEVYFTGIIRDMRGRKMSKSLGNSPDPLDVIAEFGADALRFTIARLSPIGQDVYYSDKMCELGRNFANKIWNASRFVTAVTAGGIVLPPEAKKELFSPDDKFILSRLQNTIAAVTRELKRYHFNDAALNLYDFFWHQFCDRYLEAAKFSLSVCGEEREAVVRGVLRYVLAESLKLLHPFMPFISEEIWQRINGAEPLIQTPWPVSNRKLKFRRAEEQASLKYELITAARSLRKDYEISLKQKLNFVIKPASRGQAEFLSGEAESMAALIKSCGVKIDPAYSSSGSVPTSLVNGCEIFMPLQGIVDLKQERKRLSRKLEKARTELGRVEARLRNPDFLSKAPPEVRQKNESRKEELSREAEKLDDILSRL